MALLSSDTFNRANSTTTLGSTDGAGSKDPAAWTANVGTWGINTNQAYCPTPGASAAYATVDLGTADVDVSVTLTNLGGGNGAGILFRMQSPGNYFTFEVEASIRIFRYASGSPTSLLNVAGGANGDVLRVVARGLGIDFYRNGSLLASISDSNYSTATKHGLWQFNNTTARYDNFSATGFGSYLSSDSFNRANNASLSLTDGAGSLDPVAWTNVAPAWGITSNAAKPSGTNGFALIDAGTADVDISVTVATEGNGGLIFRYNDATNYWVFWDEFGTLRLDKVIGNVPTHVSGDMNVGTNGEVLRVVAVGNSIKVYQGASLLYTATDSYNSTFKKVGLWSSGAFGSYDNFSASSTTVTTTVTGTQALETDSGISGTINTFVTGTQATETDGLVMGSVVSVPPPPPPPPAIFIKQAVLTPYGYPLPYNAIFPSQLPILVFPSPPFYNSTVLQVQTKVPIAKDPGKFSLNYMIEVPTPYFRHRIITTSLNTEISLPVGVTTVTIVPPADNTSAIRIKGDPTDVGILLHKTNPSQITFSPALNSFYIQSDFPIDIRFSFL